MTKRWVSTVTFAFYFDDEPDSQELATIAGWTRESIDNAYTSAATDIRHNCTAPVEVGAKAEGIKKAEGR